MRGDSTLRSLLISSVPKSPIALPLNLQFDNIDSKKGQEDGEKGERKE